MRFVDGEVRVSVPATSANLGPGYDALGLALDLRDEVTASVRHDRGGVVTVTGEGADLVPLDESHLVYRSMARAFERLGCPVPGVRLHCLNAIPHGRGLGSSSAAIVAGVAAARALVAGGTEMMDDHALFALAADLEGHPDNVAPAVFGGLTIAYADEGTWRAASSPVDPRIAPVVFVPPHPLATALARELLPGTVTHAAAAANAGRAALLVAALAGRPELLLDATRDWLHQDQRERAMPETLAFLRQLRADGLPAVVSGAGPTVLVLSNASIVASVLARVPKGWRALPVRVDTHGVALA